MLKILFKDGVEIITIAVHFFDDGIRWAIPPFSQERSEAKYDEIHAIVKAS